MFSALHAVPFSYCVQQQLTQLNVPDHKPADAEEDLFSRKLKARSKLRRYTPFGHSVIDDSDKHRQTSTVREPAQKSIIELNTTPSANYNRLDNEALNSRRQQTNLSFHVVAGNMPLQFHRRTGKNSVKQLLPPSLQSEDLKLEPKSFVYHSNVPHHSLKYFVLSPPQKQSQTYPPQLLREEPHISTEHIKFGIQPDQKYSTPHTWLSHLDEADVLPKIARPIYPVPSQERTESSQSLYTRFLQPVQSKKVSFHFTQGKQELEIPQQKPEDGNPFAESKLAKQQQLDLEVQQEAEHKKQNHVTQRPHQTSPESHTTGKRILPENLQRAENKSKGMNRNRNLTTNIQDSFINQQSICPYNQYMAQQTRSLCEPYCKYHSKNKESFPAQFSTGRNDSDNETPKKDFSINIQISVRNQQVANTHKEEMEESEHGVNQLGFLNHSVSIHILSDESKSGQTITHHDPKSKDVVINLEHVLEGQQSVNLINRHKEQIQQTYNKPDYLNILNNAQMFHEKLATGQNVPENINKTNDVVTSSQFSSDDQESTHSYDQLEGQPEVRFLHNISTTQFLPEKQTTGPNITQADIKPNDVLTSIQNASGSQHSLHPNNQHKEQITHEYNETPFLKLSNDTQILPETPASGINITGNVNIGTNIQISLDDQQPKYPYDQGKGQPEYVFSEARILHHPDDNEVLPEKLTAGTNITQDDTTQKDVVSTFQNVLQNQHSAYPNNHREEQIESTYNEAHFLNQSNGTQVLAERATNGTNITETINKDKEGFAKFTVSLENQQLIYPYDKYEEEKEHMLHETRSLDQPKSSNILPEKLPLEPNITKNDIKQNDVVTNTEDSLRKEHKEQAENMPEEGSFSYQPNGTQVISAKHATRPNKTVNEINTKHLSNNESSTIYQTVNVTANTTVNTVKLQGEPGIENGKFLKNVTNRSVTEVPFSSVPLSNSTNQSDLQIANRFDMEQSSSQKHTAPETTTRNPNRKNLKRQETTTRKPATLKSPTLRQATPKPGTRTEVTRKPVLRKAATHISSTQKTLPPTPTSSTPSTTKLSVQSQSTQKNSARASRKHKSYVQTSYTSTSTQTPTQTTSTKSPSTETPPTQTASTELSYTQTTSLDTTYTQIPSTPSPFAQQ